MSIHKEIPIGEVMTRYPYSIEASEKVSVASEVMEKHSIRHLPVVRQGNPVSILSSRDVDLVLKNVLTRGDSSDDMIVAQICPLQAYMVPMSETLLTVVREMHAKHIGSAIVTKDGRLAGIFTATDACRLLGDLIVQLPDSEDE